MRRCDVVIVGGGPAGATCAWALGGAGVDVVLIDRERFPRDKPCAGWVTPAVFDAIGVAPSAYAATGCTLQPFTAFQTSVMGGPAVTTAFPWPVSYGILRREFDAFLLHRVRTPVLEGTPLVTLRREAGAWIVNEALSAPVVVGAAGHFCPVSRRVCQAPPRHLVLARQIELPLAPDEPCGVSRETPELFFSQDLDGYGWCVRKADHLNVGIGRRSGVAFRSHVTAFAALLKREGRVPARATDWRTWQGHAYVLAGEQGPAFADGLVLIGDAAGLAARESGEGIGPAVESGLAAVKTIVATEGRTGVDDWQPYTDWVNAHAPRPSLAASVRAHVPAFAGRLLLRSPSFARLVVERWFLRHPSGLPAA